MVVRAEEATHGALSVLHAVMPTTIKIGSCVALILLFIWPALYNGQPFFAPDTTAYIRGFDAGVVWLSGRTSAWTTWSAKLFTYQRPPNPPAATQPVRAGIEEGNGADSSFESPAFILAGHSVCYGALLYLGHLLGGLWVSLVIQATAALAAVGLTLRHLKLFSWPRFVLIAGILGLTSSLPFFASYLMPDVFAGLAILAAANLLALGERLNPCERAFWILILGAAVVFHPSHVLIAAMLLATAIVGRLLSKKISRLGIVTLVIATGVGFGSEIGFDLIIKKLLDVQVARPPDIMARMIADGPGAAFLREKCPQGGFVVCEFLDPTNPDAFLTNSDAFLWDTTGIYTRAPIEKRQELGNEQYRFAAAVFAYDPIGQMAASFKDTFQQLKMVGLADFRAGIEERLHLPPSYARDMARSAVWTNDFPLTIFSTVTIFAAALSSIFIGVALIRHWKDISPELKVICIVIFLGFCLNAFICGTLSGPHERYQARLTWLFLLGALVLCCERSNRLASRTDCGTVSNLPLQYP